MEVRGERNITLRPSTERRPLRMHSLRPVPSTITSYSSSMPTQLSLINYMKEIEMQKSELREGEKTN